MEKKNIFFIGIGGIGMSGLAEYFLRNGYIVSGSDMNETHITQRLAKLGAIVYYGHSSSNITPNLDIVVYSSAVKNDNPEIIKSQELGLRIIRRAEMLGEIVNDKYLIAISGTHGKTTTTAMIGKLLVDAGLDPLIFVGGNVKLFDGGAYRFGSGKYAVVEADEYDRSFLTLRPDISIVTNIDADHLDIYKDIDDIKDTFRQFCDKTKYGAYIVYCGDDENIKSFINSINREKISYGYDQKNYLKIIDYFTEGNTVQFNILNSHSRFDNIALKIAGKHNALNSTACFAVSKILEIPFEVYKNSIAGFNTVDRRLELKYDAHGIKVYDDYSHHPVEVTASLKALKDMLCNKLTTVFQPHLFTRTRDFYKEFASALSISDEVILMDIYPAREKSIEGINSELIFNEALKNNVNIKLIHDRGEILADLIQNLIPGGIIVFQGAGDITELCNEFINILNKQN